MENNLEKAASEINERLAKAFCDGAMSIKKLLHCQNWLRF
jgi:hypothetical protein